MKFDSIVKTSDVIGGVFIFFGMYVGLTFVDIVRYNISTALSYTQTNLHYALYALLGSILLSTYQENVYIFKRVVVIGAICLGVYIVMKGHAGTFIDALINLLREAKTSLPVNQPSQGGYPYQQGPYPHRR